MQLNADNMTGHQLAFTGITRIEVPILLEQATELKTYATQVCELPRLAHLLRKKVDGVPFLRFSARGNGALIDQIPLLPVKVSRSVVGAEFDRLKESVLVRCKTEKSPLVSPFVSEGERGILNAALEAGQSAVWLAQFDIARDDNLSELHRSALGEGRLLLLSPWPPEAAQTSFVRGRCMLLNMAAAYLAIRTVKS